MPDCTIYEYLLENNKDHPSDIAIIYFDRKITYGELFANIDKTAAAFLKAGVKEKEIVTVALPSIPEALYCVYALNKIGAVANMIHPLAGKKETLSYFNEVHSRIAVIFDGAYETIVADIGKSSVEKVIVASAADSLPFMYKAIYHLKTKNPKLDGKVFQSWKVFLQEGRWTDAVAVHKDCHEMAIISHTGGTTGEPKGCMISDYNVNAEIFQIGMSMAHGRQEIMMTQLPPFVNYNLVNGMLEPMAFGFTNVLIPKYEPLKFAEYVSKYRVNHINSIPPYCEAITKISDIEKYNLKSLKYIFYGGEGMTEEMEIKINEVLTRCGVKGKLQKGMGMTEVTSAASATYDSVNPFESVGIPLSKTIFKIIDVENGEEKQYEEVGEICISGPTVMIGYYNHPDETDELIRIHKDGGRWLHTGDLGYINKNGVVFIKGRIKRIIMTKGEDGQVTKLFPDRIEKTVSKHEAVDLCCAIGVPDEIRINYPVVFVVLKPGVEEREQITEEIISLCRTELPDYMVPEAVIYRDDLPRTPRGKIDYRALEKQQ